MNTYDGDQILRDDLVEPSEQCFDLLLDGRVETVLGRKLNELALVFLSDWSSTSVLFEVNDLGHTKLQIAVSDTPSARQTTDAPPLPRR